MISSRWWVACVRAAAPGVGDRLVGGQCGALGPGGVKVLLIQGVSQRRHRYFVASVRELEADRADALPDGVRRAEKPYGVYNLSISRPMRALSR